MAGVPEEEIRVIISAYMYNADVNYGKAVAKEANAPLRKVKIVAKQLLEAQAQREKHAKKVADGYNRIAYRQDF